MRLGFSKSKNSTSLYVIKSTYVNKKHSSEIVEKLGTLEHIKEIYNTNDPVAWAKNYVSELNKMDKEDGGSVKIEYSPKKSINANEQRFFSGGYLFLQKIYYELGLHEICKEISLRHKFEFDINGVLSRLIYGRIIFPKSKLATCEEAKKFLEPPTFSIQNVYRGLDVLSMEKDFIQAKIYENSLKIMKRKTGVIYYDCTNFFFETQQECGLRQYGMSKEHRPNPIVQMGLMMDSEGIPLAFCINKGNTNEQTTLQPIEQKIIDDYKLSKFVVCTDAGLSSAANRRFNDVENRAFITTQSVKTLKNHIKSWALDGAGWQVAESDKEYNLNEEPESEKIYYKERWIKENGLEQRIIVTFSFKYKNYQHEIRNKQILRVQKSLDKNPNTFDKKNSNDYKRFVKKISHTTNGEVAAKTLYNLDTERVLSEEQYDGFYAVCTNLDDEAEKIAQISHNRWQIENCFRIMKTEFKSRPTYLQSDNRIEAHFLTCFIALIVYKILEKKLDGKFTCGEIIQGLKSFNFLKMGTNGYIPTYTKNKFTDLLHEKFGFRTDTEIVKSKEMNIIFKKTKKL